MVQSSRALHASLLKIALHHSNISKNLTISAEQRYWKMHPHGCFWWQLQFGNFPEWLLLKDSCNDIFWFILEILSYTYFTFLTVTSCKRGTNFYGFLLGRGFLEKCNHTELALNFIQKQYFSPRKTFSFYYSRIATPWIRKKLFLKFSFLKDTQRP